MGSKLAWAGLAFLLAGPKFGLGMTFEVVGALLLACGAVLIVLDR